MGDSPDPAVQGGLHPAPGPGPGAFAAGRAAGLPQRRDLGGRAVRAVGHQRLRQAVRGGHGGGGEVLRFDYPAGRRSGRRVCQLQRPELWRGPHGPDQGRAALLRRAVHGWLGGDGRRAAGLWPAAAGSADRGRPWGAGADSGGGL